MWMVSHSIWHRSKRQLRSGPLAFIRGIDRFRALGIGLALACNWANEGGLFKCKWSFYDTPSHEPLLQATIMDKSLWTYLHFWCFCAHARREYNFTCLTSPPTPHTMLKTGNCNFSWFSTGGEGKQQRVFKFSCKDNSLHYITVPRTFVHNCTCRGLIWIHVE